MSSEQLEILCDGLMVYEVDPICEKLAAKGVRFKVVRVTDEEAGIVNPRKDNWASGLSQVCNYFNQGGLTEHLRILVVAEDLELAKSVIAPAESRPLLHESRPNLKLLILVVLAVLFGAVAWLATTYWAEPEPQGGCAERQAEGPQRIAVFSGGLDEEMAATICDLSGKPDPQVILFCTAGEDATNNIEHYARPFRAAGARVEPVKIWAEEPKDIVALRQRIMKADIIWFGGGWTEYLVRKLHDYYLYASLWAAYQRGTVMAGFSAGAILLSFAGYNDFRLRDGVRYDFIDGMGIVDAYFCPHYQDEVWRGFDKRLEEELAYVDCFEVPETAWAQEDGTMITFRNDEPEVKVLRPGAKVYRFKRTDCSWVKKEFRGE